MQEIKVGDIVRVIDWGRGYTTYEEWAKKNGLSEYRAGNDVVEGNLYEVVAKALHSEGSLWTLLGLEGEDGKQYIIGIEGVEKIPPSKFNFICSGYPDSVHSAEIIDDLVRVEWAKGWDGYPETRTGDWWKSVGVRLAEEWIRTGEWIIVESKQEPIKSENTLWNPIIERHSGIIISLQPVFEGDVVVAFEVFRGIHSIGYRAANLVAKYFEDGFWYVDKEQT
jgi:hypothetical protein